MNPKGGRVFGKDHAQNKELGRDDHSLKLNPIQGGIDMKSREASSTVACRECP
jgi:hypothetical protein